MRNRNITDEQLLDFLDGQGTESERSALRDAITQNHGTKIRLKQLEAVHLFLQNQKGIEHPSKSFTEKVMSGLHVRPSFTFFSPKNGLMLLAGLLVASGLALTLLSSGAFDQWHTIFNVGALPVKTNLIKMPTSIPFDVKMAVKIFVMINLIIAFILLDRTILRPIFQKRSEKLIL